MDLTQYESQVFLHDGDEYLDYIDDYPEYDSGEEAYLLLSNSMSNGR